MSTRQRDAAAALDGDAAVILVARHVLEGPVDEGRASYQIALTTCENCKRSWQQAKGNPVEVGAEIVEMARCDGQHLGNVSDLVARVTHVGEKKEPALAGRRA